MPGTGETSGSVGIQPAWSRTDGRPRTVSADGRPAAVWPLEERRVCFIAGTLGQGGAEQQLFYMLQALRNAGASVRLLSLTRQEVWQERIEALGVPVTWVGKSASRWRRFRDIVTELRRQPPEIVQSQHFFTNLYAVAAARELGIHEVAAIRNNVVSDVRHTGALMGRLSLHLPRTIAANSQAAIRVALERGVAPRRLHLLPNVVDAARFHPRPWSDGDVVRVLGIGRLVEQKRFDRFLRVFARARERSDRELRAVIAGDGALQPRLVAQATALGLPPSAVEFRGLTRDPVPLYQEADVLLLTSDYEGMPNVVLEAMACGLPVVATRVGGVPEIVRHGVTGLIAEPDSEERLVDALVQLAGDAHERRRLAGGARRFVERDRSPEGLPLVLGRLYQAVLSGEPPPAEHDPEQEGAAR
jgi:glycosyltransferase involved in cell wall biosynthesis